MRARAIMCVGVVLLAGCESRAAKVERLRAEADAACGAAAEVKQRFDSAFGKWMSQYPDTLRAVTAAYGDTIEARQKECDAANREYETARQQPR